ncbi:site-specific integrase [Nocardia sp. NBC_01730]|uniref:tyrosine-type recombinase/integrase n=1 Tax=Nocardia sp. NBC_01730 TaxID=2975998 RepID=UPI002E1045B0|nr:site-specific integrase [Nocardia sp. NBC_01730]
MSAGAARAADIAAALRVLDGLGLNLADLHTTPPPRPPAPTFAEFIPAVHDAMPAGRTRDHYKTYWDKLLQQNGWPEHRIDEVTLAQLEQLAEKIKASRVRRRNGRDGRKVVQHVIDALRYLYRRAEHDELIDPADNPTTKLDKPRTLPSTRRALPAALLAEIGRVAATTGNDPELDTLLLRLHTETACRRAGALVLRPRDLDPLQCLILLREKGDTQRWQPVSPTLMRALCRHSEDRGGAANEQLLRYRNGHPITRRRYDHLFNRLGRHLPWVLTHGISIHWLRHTTLTWVERTFSYAVAREFAGHTDNHSEGATTTYIRATVEEVAAAVALLTGEPHPLASSDGAAWMQLDPATIRTKEISS